MNIFGLTFGSVYGLCDDPKALAQAQWSAAQQIEYNRNMAQATPLYNYQNLANFFAPKPDSRSLDERFADFKIRLAALIEKHKRK